MRSPFYSRDPAISRRLARLERPSCACYVRRLRPEVRFGLHDGAHALDCPTYSPSLDPVDRANDDDFRAAAMIEAPAITEIPVAFD